MAITPLPPAPQRTDDPVNFATKADAFIAALPNFVAEVNSQLSPGRLLNIQKFTASGTYTPTAGTNFVVVEIVGGGGGSGGAQGSGVGAMSASGAPGAYALAKIASPGVQTITIGAGGAGASISSSGGSAGGSSSFGSLITAPGGSGSAPGQSAGSNIAIGGIEASAVSGTVIYSSSEAGGDAIFLGIGGGVTAKKRSALGLFGYGAAGNKYVGSAGGGGNPGGAGACIVYEYS